MNPKTRSSFKAKRVSRSFIQTINATPAKVHSLICPVKEAEWLDGWDYDLIFSHSGLAEKGCVFTSRSAGEKDTIWLITQRDDAACETVFARSHQLYDYRNSRGGKSVYRKFYRR